MTEKRIYCSEEVKDVFEILSDIEGADNQKEMFRELVKSYIENNDIGEDVEDKISLQ